MKSLRRWLWAMIGLGCVAAIAYAFLHAGELVDRFAPFSLDRPPDLLTTVHLWLLKHDPDRCFAALDQGHIGYDRIPGGEPAALNRVQPNMIRWSRMQVSGEYREGQFAFADSRLSPLWKAK